uniref:Matrin-type domain-containing protein n=1 Tax=viral metagenome TaxID=1070528 RepID=A0A6C0DKJ8_9ZZZZ
METIGNKNPQKNPKKFYCEICNYYTCNSKDFKRHLDTKKHQGNTWKQKIPKKTQSSYFCKCGIIFSSRSGLWKHHKTCEYILNKNDEFEIYELNKETLVEIIKQNNEFQKDMQKQMFEFIKENIACSTSVNTITTVNNNNSNNKTFNLQVFLNETCKDAMNIMDFVESVKLQVADLENVGKVGYIEGISNIIIKNLQALDVDKRPVHCADQKREVMYVKDQNTWEKEDETNKKLRKAIRMIAHKNICMLKEFRSKYPDCEEYDSKKNDQYNKIVYESMGGKGDNDYDKDTKIIKKIAKNVTIDKN